MENGPELKSRGDGLRQTFHVTGPGNAATSVSEYSGMGVAVRGLLWSAAAACLAGPSFAASTPPVDAVRTVAVAATEAALKIAEDDRPAAGVFLSLAADAAATDAPLDRRAEVVALARVRSGLEKSIARLNDPASGDEAVVAALRRVVRDARAAERTIRKRVGGVDLRESRSGFGFHRPGSKVTFLVSGCDETPLVTVTPASPNPLVRALEPGVETLAPGRFRVSLGPDLGGARVTVTACGESRVWLLFNEGRRGALRVAAPSAPSYPAGTLALRAGVAATAVSPGGAADAYEVSPPLPAGLALDARTGRISGKPSSASPARDYSVIARNRRGAASATISVQVAPPLPPEFAWLEDGFAVEPVAQSLDVPVKMAFAPDGRLFFSELVTGNVRIVSAAGTLLPAPFATVPVAGGGERGLLGIAIAPDFETSGHVFVFAATAADAVLPERSRILRLTATGDTGSDLTVIVDSLPVSDSQNGGALAFGPDGKLYATIGDTGDPALAQTDGALAGRVLRFNPDGSIPADNPIPGSPEWCRGLRNSFDITFSPATGGLFASENGPMANDELEFIQPGKNYGWGAADPESIPGPEVGYRMVDWSPVIVPTGITFLAKGAFGPEYAGSLFVAGYDAADLRRVVLSGAALTDVDEELPFARWENVGVANRPLDAVEAPDGSLVVSTFTAIWRFTRY